MKTKKRKLLSGLVAGWLSICFVLFVQLLSVPAAAAESEIVGNAAAILSNANAYCEESALGDLAADVVRQATGADAAVVPSGDLGQYLMGGPVTLADLQAAIPENSEYVLAKVSPAQLKALLEEGVSQITLTEAEKIDYAASETDGFLQVSGIQLRCDATAPVGERILDVFLDDGTELELEQETPQLQLALPAALAVEKLGQQGTSCGGLQDMMLACFRENDSVSVPEEGRIQIIGAHANELISSGPVIMVGLILLVCAVMSIPVVLRQKKDPNARESMYFTGVFNLRNKKK